MSSFACENIHQSQERINDESRGRKEINLWLASLLCDQLLPIREWKCHDINQVLHHGLCFLSSASSSTEKPGQNRSCYEQFKMCIVLWSESHSTTFTRVLRPWRSIIKSKSVQFVADNSTAESYFLSVSVSVEANELKTCQSLVEASYANEDIQQNKNI